MAVFVEGEQRSVVTVFMAPLYLATLAVALLPCRSPCVCYFDGVITVTMHEFLVLFCRGREKNARKRKMKQEYTVARRQQCAREDLDGAVDGRVLSAPGGLGAIRHVLVLQQLGRQRRAHALFGLGVSKRDTGTETDGV